MTDQQMLEAAARAVGLPFLGADKHGAYLSSGRDADAELWNPLEYGDDALALLGWLGGASIGVGPSTVVARYTPPSVGDEIVVELFHNGDRPLALRRAIVELAVRISQQQALGRLAQADRELGLDYGDPS